MRFVWILGDSLNFQAQPAWRARRPLGNPPIHPKIGCIRSCTSITD